MQAVWDGKQYEDVKRGEWSVEREGRNVMVMGNRGGERVQGAVNKTENIESFDKLRTSYRTANGE